MDREEVRHRILAGLAEGQWVHFDRIVPEASDASETDVAEENAVGKAARPGIDAAFISALWRGAQPDAKITESGIRLWGLDIAGEIEVRGAKGTRGTGEGLPPLLLYDCTIGGIDASGARISDLWIAECEIGNVDLADTESVGPVYFGDCEVAARFDMTNARIRGDVMLMDCTLSGLTMSDLRTTGDADIRGCTLGKDGEPVGATGMRIERRLRILDSRFRSPANLAGLHAASFRCERSSFDAASKTVALDLQNAQLDGELLFDAVRARGTIDASYANVGGRIRATRLFVSQRGVRSEAAFNLQSATAAKDVAISSSRICNLVLLDARIEQGLWISGCRFSLEKGVGLGGTIVAMNCQAEEVRVQRSVIEGLASFSSARISGDFDFRDVTIGCRFRPASLSLPPSDKVGLNFGFASIGFMTVLRCYVHGQIMGRNASIGSQLLLKTCMARTDPETWSVQIEGITLPSIATLERVGASSGMALPGLNCSELQITGCVVSAWMGAPKEPQAMWASDCRIGRRIQFKAARDDTFDGPRHHSSRVVGLIDFSNSNVGEAVIVRDLDASLPAPADALHCMTVLDFSRCKIVGDLRLNAHGYGGLNTDAERDSAARLHGCVSIDKAEIDGDVDINGTVIRRLGTVTAQPKTALAEDQIGTRKLGVALSLFRAHVKGDLIIGKPKLSGLVDLRNAFIHMIQDGSGTRWEKVGIKPGGMLLDGLRYDDLDLISDADTGNRHRAAEDQAARRLAWLRMQFPGRRPDRARFVSQPYEQLARMFGQEGEDRARRKILLEKRDLQRRYGRISQFERSIGWLLKVTSDYGYSPARAFGWLALHICCGALLASWLHAQGILDLAQTDAKPSIGFNPLVYAIDAAIPIVNLDQDGVFTILTAKLPAWPHAQALVMIGKAIYQLVGLALASITILTLTGVLREKD